MIIRIPQEFQLETAPVTATVTKNDVALLLDGLPAQAEFLEDEIQLSFDSPRAAAEAVTELGNVIPYVLGEATIDEEIAFNAALAELGMSDHVHKRRSGLAVAALSVAIPAAVLAVAGIVLGILGIAL